MFISAWICQVTISGQGNMRTKISIYPSELTCRLQACLEFLFTSVALSQKTDMKGITR